MRGVGMGVPRDQELGAGGCCAESKLAAQNKPGKPRSNRNVITFARKGARGWEILLFGDKQYWVSFDAAMFLSSDI
jgi:hypothetical protein